MLFRSDFQINRLRLLPHCYIDGTFVVVPIGFNRLINIAIRDPNTGQIRPAVWGLVNAEIYYMFFKMLSDVVTNFGEFEWKLQYITLDFEAGLINAVQKVFPEVRLIGCLFHLKQALWREAQQLGLTTAACKGTSLAVISSLGQVSWKGNDEIINN